MTNGLAMDGSWNTTSTGTKTASAAVSGGRICYGIFNHATQALGGAVTVRRFDLTTP